MDHQASTRRKVSWFLTVIRTALCTIFIGTLCCTLLFAQTTTNPLIESVVISAFVLENPATRPNTPPLAPGPINMSNTVDLAIFRGLAYASGTVSLLKNGSIISQIKTNSDGTFDLRVRDLTSGTYSFGIRAQDENGLQSKLLVFTIFISSSVATLVDGIFIPPTVTSDKIEVKRSDVITFFGTSASNAEVRLSFSSRQEIIERVRADDRGKWTYDLDTTGFELGDYEAKGRSLTVQNLSPYSEVITFRIGNTNRLRAKSFLLSGFRKKCDLNDDNRVNLLDFSIMAFWYKRLGFPPKVDLNGDKQINLIDLSILAFCWTG
jgi:hypothetical protein